MEPMNCKYLAELHQCDVINTSLLLSELWTGNWIADLPVRCRKKKNAISILRKSSSRQVTKLDGE